MVGVILIFLNVNSFDVLTGVFLADDAGKILVLDGVCVNPFDVTGTELPAINN